MIMQDLKFDNDGQVIELLLVIPANAGIQWTPLTS
jgi:hypothetical protein